MRSYEIEMKSGKLYSVKSKSAQLAVNYVYGFIGEHDEVKKVVRLSESGKRVDCIWK